MSKPTPEQVHLRIVQRTLRDLHGKIAAMHGAAEMRLPIRGEHIADLHRETHQLMVDLDRLGSTIDQRAQRRQQPIDEIRAAQALAAYMSATGGDPVEDCIDTALSLVRQAVPPGSGRPNHQQPQPESGSSDVTRSHQPTSPMSGFLTDLRALRARLSRASSTVKPGDAPKQSGQPDSPTASSRPGSDSQRRRPLRPGEINPNDLPPEERARLKRFLRQSVGLSDTQAEEALNTGSVELDPNSQSGFAGLVSLGLDPDSLADLPPGLGSLLDLVRTVSRHRQRSRPSGFPDALIEMLGDSADVIERDPDGIRLRRRSRRPEGSPPSGAEPTPGPETQEKDSNPDGQGQVDSELRTPAFTVDQADLLRQGAPLIGSGDPSLDSAPFPFAADETDVSREGMPPVIGATVTEAGGTKPGIDYPAAVAAIDESRTARGDESLGEIVEKVIRTGEPTIPAGVLDAIDAARTERGDQPLGKIVEEVRRTGEPDQESDETGPPSTPTE